MTSHPSPWNDPRYGLPDPWPIIGGDLALQAIEVATSVVARRWKPAILVTLAEGPHRYNVLQRRLPGITAKMLTQQLRELEQDGLIRHEAHATGARVSTYTLTPIGEALRPVIEAMLAWSREYAEFRRFRDARALDGAEGRSDQAAGRREERGTPRHALPTRPPSARGTDTGWRAGAASEALPRRDRTG
ncbi:MAG: helix-turn-helix transcriptional regulator [Gemmatimonadaceae bacterium]|jgi:DNA-binding HxlR family transcriptional regulator|nr:helix-turn-helix transcriptional regulator [Gemmatimonadaceae bacterium]